ncbi:MAG TPA: hypothetical protein VNS58_01435 [Puia sp.]|nr:hypothetical protein [Puia sp.]
MTKDRRYTTVRNLIGAGYIKAFREIFDTLPKSVVARDLGMNNKRFSRLMDNVDEFSLKEIFLIAFFLDINESVMLDIVLQQRAQDRK